MKSKKKIIITNITIIIHYDFGFDFLKLILYRFYIFIAFITIIFHHVLL